MSPIAYTRRTVLLRAFQTADSAVAGLCFLLAFVVSAAGNAARGPWDIVGVKIGLLNLLGLAALAVAWHVVLRSQGLYRSHRMGHLSDEWWSVTKAVGLGTLIIVVGAFLFDVAFLNRRFVLIFVTLVLPATLLTRVVLRLFLAGVRRRGRNLRKVVIVGCGRRATYFATKIRQRPELGYLLVGFIDDIPPPVRAGNGQKEKLLGSLDQLEELLESPEIDEVFVALPVKSQYQVIERVIRLAKTLGLIVRLPADCFELGIATATVDYLDDDPVLMLQTPRPASAGRVFKRTIDVVGSLAALILLAPLFAMVAALIKIDSRGPVFFSQDRIGLHRRKFRMLKFRTMVANAEALQAELEEKNEVKGAAFKIASDPRITRVGRHLRRFSVDELPQFFNVLRGDMSLVGPRPLPIRDVEAFQSQWEKRRFSMQPGLTCLWQANGRHRINFDHWMDLDLQYIDGWSLKLDLEILAKTVPAVLRGSGAN